MSTALLMLFGGRSMPNMLTVIHEKPEHITAIVSRNATASLPQLEETIHMLFKDAEYMPTLDTTCHVDAYNHHEVYKKCREAVENPEYAGYDWIFNVTAATTIMSIGAYEAAKDLAAQGRTVRCWYLATAQEQVVALVGEGRDADIFHLSTDQYAAVYNCRLGQGKMEDQRNYCQEHWIPFTHFLVDHPACIPTLNVFMKKDLAQGPGKGSTKCFPVVSPLTPALRMLLEAAHQANLLTIQELTAQSASVELNYQQANFLRGPWLEAYVWDEARKLGTFSDCQWNLKIVDAKRPDDKENKNELDVVMIYKAQLILAECKTGDDSFESDVLYQLDSVARPLGANFVSKLLITSQSQQDKMDRNAQQKYQEFRQKADERGIIVLTREELPVVGEELKKLTNSPKYTRN